MRSIITPAGLALAIVVHASGVAAECAPRSPGDGYPWQSQNHVAGDEWGRFHIDLDMRGQPVACRAVDTNMSRERIFWACRALTVQGDFHPVAVNGEAVPGTVTRQLLLLGHEHERLNERARTAYFATHPDEKPSCYR